MTLSLRKIEPQDLPYLYQWENDAAAWADGSNHNPLSRHDLRQYIGQTTGDIYKDGQLRMVIVGSAKSKVQNAELEETMGCVDLFDLDARNGRAAIGIYLAPAYRGKGYAQQALQQLEQYAFDFLHLRLLYAVIATRNQASRHLFEQQGYHPSSPLPHWTLESDAQIWTKINKIG